jgi:hypothetical protein
MENTKYLVQKYKPDNEYEFSGLIGMILALLACSIVLGIAASYISKFIYLIIAFPFLIGAGLGFVGSKIVKKAAFRNTLIAGISGFIAGVFAMCCMHYTNYFNFINDVKKLDPEIVKILNLPEAEKRNIIKKYSAEDQKAFAELDKDIKVTNPEGYMRFLAHEGVSINKVGRSDGGINLGFIGSFIYWIIEILFSAFVAAYFISKAAAKPFCARCSKWKEEKTFGFLTGKKNEVVQAIQSGDFSQISRFAPSPSVTGLSLSEAFCKTCHASTPIDVKVIEIVEKKKNKKKMNTIAHVTYPGEAEAVFERLFSPEAKPE